MPTKEETAAAPLHNSPTDNAVKALGEVVLPGGSLLLEGDIKGGVVHAALGIAAAVVLGPFGRLLVSTNAFSRATTRKNLTEHF